ncbi:MAG: ATP-binding protein [Bacteroidales bacterium]|nr:ATP-binding protein [Bacteroidales bacterium]
MGEEIKKCEPKVFIEKLKFNSGQVFDFENSDIIVFTGSNNVGKSQVLRDIMHYFEKKESPKVVVSDVEVSKIGDIKEIKDKFYFRNNMYEYGSIRTTDLNYVEYSWNNDLTLLHKLFINHLSTENRLQAANPSNSFDVANTTPSNPIQELYVDDTKEQELSKLFHRAFDTTIVLNRGAGNVIPIHVGEKPSLAEGEDRVSSSFLKKLRDLPQIQDQGDGMRSFMGILLNVFTSNHTITLIDEPEAFLHPPQARLLGKMLSMNTPNNRQLFISTHSEDFLKGLIDAENDRVKVFRINRNGNTNNMNLLSNENIKTLWKDPILRYSNILSGLFHSKVVVCESDTDCRFYQAMANMLNNDDKSLSPDILFTHCGGKQRLKTVVNALKALNVKIACITDIDILNEKDTFFGLVESIGLIWTDVESDWKIIDQYVRSQRSQLDTTDVKKEISKIMESIHDSIFPKEAAESIKAIIKKSSAWGKVKESGKMFFIGGSYDAYKRISEKCARAGLFIVPVGELECFYRPDSNHGTKWVNYVLDNIDLSKNEELKEARSFVEEVLAY